MNTHETFYSEELVAVKNIYNRKTVLQNFVYKLNLDRNISDFLEQLSEKAKNYDSLEHMDKYYFERKLKAYSNVLNNLLILMECVETISSHSAEEISKDCRVLPDSTGKELMYFLGYLPLIEAIKRKSDFVTFFKKKKEEVSDEMKKFYNTKLFDKKSWHYDHFPSNKSIVDNETLKKKIEFEKEHYESSMKGELENAISMLSELINSTKKEDLRRVMIELGKNYWDARKKTKDEKVQRLSEALTALANGLDVKKKKENN